MSTNKLHHNRYLPEEIIVQILCRLPMKPLIRFSSVSERWHYLIIEDPQFCPIPLQASLRSQNPHSETPHFHRLSNPILGPRNAVVRRQQFFAQ
ncbi:unnamed protein product [Prunus armeniaca]|uniref:F-box domain-containing protein n=1 Tax=Prunus armeniaca TaxID=36596 RepID=A0A6J5WIT7_PRUAR|nr:unnamed protein product [Prunus armeniaca]